MPAPARLPSGTPSPHSYLHHCISGILSHLAALANVKAVSAVEGVHQVRAQGSWLSASLDHWHLCGLADDLCHQRDGYLAELMERMGFASRLKKQ